MEEQFASVMEFAQWLSARGDKMREVAVSKDDDDAQERCYGRAMAFYSLASQLRNGEIILQGFQFDTEGQ